MNKNKTILLTGATGMIGTALVDMLMEQNQKGANVTIIAMGRDIQKGKVRFSSYWDSKLFCFMEHDINDPVPDTLLEGRSIDYIIHGASTTHPVAYASEPVETMTANMIGAKHLLDLAVQKKIEKFLFLSSVEIYGENRGDVESFDESYCGYMDCNTLRAGYPESKRATEALCQAYRKQYGLSVLISRLSRVYGPTMQLSDSKAIAQFIMNAAKGEDIVLKSAGNQLYSYTYVTDAAAGILKVLEMGEVGEAYNIADPLSQITLKDLADLLAEISGKKVIYEIPDEVEQAGYSKVQKALLNSDKIQRLGWKAEIHMKEGLHKTVSSIKYNEKTAQV